jgi:hypothetical protein
VAGVLIIIGGGFLFGIVLARIDKTRLLDLPRWEQTLVIIALILPLILLHAWLAPRMLGVRPLRPNERVSFPLQASSGI